jgi:hypothetical protein
MHVVVVKVNMKLTYYHVSKWFKFECSQFECQSNIFWLCDFRAWQR